MCLRIASGLIVLFPFVIIAAIWLKTRSEGVWETNLVFDE